MAKGGRKSAYEEVIKPHFKEIGQMLAEGHTIAKICDGLGVSQSTWFKYVNLMPEFSELIKKSRDSLVSDIKAALKRKAIGFQYTEIKKITERGEDGKMHLVRIEETIKTSPPDVAAANVLLKNYDTENWSDNPRQDKLRRDELEWKKQHAQEVGWL